MRKNVISDTVEEKDFTELSQTWEVELLPSLTEADVLRALALRIRQMLKQDTRAFFQLMYRLDIQEARLNAALDSPDRPAAIARLIWDRQWEKARSRREHRQKAQEEDEDLIW